MLQLELQLPLEVVCADPQPVAEVEAVCVLPVLAEAGVEVELGAAAGPRLVLEPGEQAVGVAAAAGGFGGDEVVDVQVLAPREELVDAEARHGGGLRVAVREGADQPVARRSEALVDPADELLRAPVVRAQL